MVPGAGITKSGTVIGSPVIFTDVVDDWLTDTGGSGSLSDDDTCGVSSEGDWLSGAKWGG
jgi:hypothetical protein